MERRHIFETLKRSDERVERDQLKSLLTGAPSCFSQPDPKTVGVLMQLCFHTVKLADRGFLRLVSPEGKVCIMELQSN